nr:MAG TPA: hypothetical protein [Bacteriophage sp.]
MTFAFGKIRLYETIWYRKRFTWFKKLPVNKTSNIQSMYAVGKSHTLIVYKR